MKDEVKLNNKKCSVIASNQGFIYCKLVLNICWHGRRGCPAGFSVPF